MRYIALFVSIVQCFFASITVGQVNDDAIALSLTQNDVSKEIRSLPELLLLAEQHSPKLKFYNAAINVTSIKIKSEKTAWMQHMGFDADLRYGMFDNLILSQALGRDDYSTSSTKQTRYSTGVYFKMPISAISSRKKLIGIAEEEKEMAIYQRESAIRELRELVIVQYNNVLKFNRLMIISSQTRETFNVQCIRAEKDFINGLIPIAEYARLQEMLTRSTENYESYRAQYTTAYMLLEETIGVKLKP